MVTKKTQLPIMPILKVLDQKKFGLYKAFTTDESERKELERLIGYLLPIWMSGAVDDADHARMIVRFNRIANEGWFAFRNHPELQAKILACVGVGREVRHSFYKVARSTPSPKLTELLQERYRDIRRDEIRLWCQKNSEADVAELAAASGRQNDDVKAIVEEYRRLVTEQT